MDAPNVVSLRLDMDVIAASITARDVARRLGFDPVDQARIATTASEISRTMLHHCRRGAIIVLPILRDNRRGLELIYEDGNYAAQTAICCSEHTTGASREVRRFVRTRRLMDEIEVMADDAAGTRVVCRKWL